MGVMDNTDNRVERGLEAQAELADRMEVSDAVKREDDKKVCTLTLYCNSC